MKKGSKEKKDVGRCPNCGGTQYYPALQLACFDCGYYNQFEGFKYEVANMARQAGISLHI